jgi:DNA repair exonuclease SbcCD nuclease subunit
MKLAMFTDIHFGARGNSQQHLDDCLEFIDWFCEQALQHNVDGVAFLGDWFESRESIMLHTLNASHDAACRLNSLGVPVFFITGNHDIRFKTSREVSSTIIFSELSNFNVIRDTPFEVQMGKNKSVFMPFCFHEEYGENSNYINTFDYVFGHFEFKDFIVTGKTVKLEHGPDHKMFNQPKRIFSGHFHKRQLEGNVCFIGNPFPTNYGDVMDTERGMCIFDTDTNKVSFLNFQGPSFYYSSLLDLIERVDFPPKSNVKCYVDVALTYSEIQQIRDEYIKQFDLREFVVEDSFSATEMERQDGGVIEDVSRMSTKDAVTKIISEKLELLNSSIDRTKLIEIFNRLEINGKNK